MRSPCTTSASATRYFDVVRRLADEFPTETWSEERSTTSPLTTSSATTTRRRTRRSARCSARFPSGRYAERAAWKIRAGGGKSDNTETIRVFERGSANFPRSDWLFVVRVRAADSIVCDYARKVGRSRGGRRGDARLVDAARRHGPDAAARTRVLSGTHACRGRARRPAGDRALREVCGPHARALGDAELRDLRAGAGRL